MRTHGRTRLTLAVVALVGFVCAFCLGGTVFAAEQPQSSSECIKCHTDLKKMDKFGAASAAGTGGVAG
jgi:hypothetical protein